MSGLRIAAFARFPVFIFEAFGAGLVHIGTMASTPSSRRVAEHLVLLIMGILVLWCAAY